MQRSISVKASITTASDDTFSKIFPNFRNKKRMIFHENRLPAIRRVFSLFGHDDNHGFFKLAKFP